jgi:RNA polymerase sigma-70 factor (ECF subfamily)
MDHGARQANFEALLTEHRKIIFKLSAAFARNAEDRKDLAQEITVQLWRSFATYDERRAKFSTWMYRIGLNVAISQLRRHRNSLVEPLSHYHLETIAGNQPGPEEDERISALWAFINQLDALNRALMLLYLDDHSYAEIAEILGISETNVATKLSRIKQKLRQTISGSQVKGA